ncbi:acyltransferase family protein [Enterobacter hormaechei]|uniref:Acyltransferase 3 domain-containing protein n=1 Tax=Enterobacter hormaechei TaxID=158836 RepID=A0AAP8GNK8_9ENTR|nr:acyltransferase family protein [Enterobacter hormaechei]PJG40209.1 hypothetical protein CGZ54_08275 [Enterobacter hormaechei]
MNGENIRHDWIAYLRFIAIFYIYLGHFGPAAGKLYPFVFTFHVPLFFFISGLLVKRAGTNNDLISAIVKSFKRIMIPYAVFSVIGVIFLAIKDQRSSQNILQMIEMSIYGVRNNTPLATLWFFPCLFMVYSYYNVLYRFINSRVLLFVLGLVIYTLTPVWFGKAIPSLFWNIDSAWYFFVFFAAGALLSPHLNSEIKFYDNNKKKSCLYLFALMSIIYYAVCYQYGTFSFYKGIKSLEMRYFIYFFAAVFLFIPSILLAKYLDYKSKHFDIKPLLVLGRNTLVLCGTEQILKFTIVASAGIFGIKLAPHNPLEAILLTSLCFFVSYFTTIKWYYFFSNKTLQ